MQKHHKRIEDVARSEPTYRFRGHISPQDVQQSGARAEVAGTTDGTTGVIRIYDVIDSWGDFWGISASEVISALDELGDVKTIQVRINSPGGEATEGVAIYNALVNHPAQIEVYVDAMAASAASIVAMAGDQIEMLTGSQMMIHDPWLICMGNADDMTKTAEMLSHCADNLASVYAERAGGTPASWRQAMKDETWYSPQEAVDAGLATKVAKKRAKPAADEPKAQFDLSVFQHAGRENAPAPMLDTKISKTRASVPNSSKQDQENNRMTSDQLEAIGLTEDATDEQVSARLAEIMSNQIAEPTKVDETDPEVGGEEDPGKPTTAPAEEPVAPAVPEEVTAPDTVMVDKAQWEQVVAASAQASAKLAAIEASNAKAERDSYLTQAMADGKFPPAQLKGYQDYMDANPTAAKAHIDGLAKNSVPVTEVGRGDGAETPTDDTAYPTQFLTQSEIKNIRSARALQEA